MQLSTVASLVTVVLAFFEGGATADSRQVRSRRLDANSDSSVAAQNGQAAFNRGAQQEAALGGMLPGLGSLAGGLPGGGGMGNMPGGLGGMTPPGGTTAGASSMPGLGGLGSMTPPGGATAGASSMPGLGGLGGLGGTGGMTPPGGSSTYYQSPPGGYTHPSEPTSSSQSSATSNGIAGILGSVGVHAPPGGYYQYPPATYSSPPAASPPPQQQQQQQQQQQSQQQQRSPSPPPPPPPPPPSTHATVEGSAPTSAMPSSTGSLGSLQPPPNGIAAGIAEILSGIPALQPPAHRQTLTPPSFPRRLLADAAHISQQELQALVYQALGMPAPRNTTVGDLSNMITLPPLASLGLQQASSQRQDADATSGDAGVSANQDSRHAVRTRRSQAQSDTDSTQAAVSDYDESDD